MTDTLWQPEEMESLQSIFLMAASLLRKGLSAGYMCVGIA